MREFFSSIYCGNLVQFLKVNLVILGRFPYYWVPPEFLTLKVVHVVPPAIRQLQLRFFYLGPGFLAVSAPESPAQVNCFSVLACLSSLGPSDLPYVLPSLTNPGKVVDFFILLSLSLLRQSEDFHIPYVGTGAKSPLSPLGKVSFIISKEIFLKIVSDENILKLSVVMAAHVW